MRPVNPYESLSLDEKVNLLANYFFNEELQSRLPKKPVKQKHEKLGDIKPIKYEQYFAYIQRLKAIKSSWEEEEKKIMEKYEGEVGYYNGNMKTLYKHYTQKENQTDMIQHSINKALKVFFGKPKLEELKVLKNEAKIEAKLFSNNFYGYGYSFVHDVTLNVPKGELNDFYNRHRTGKVIVRVEYNEAVLSFLDLKVDLREKYITAVLKRI